MLSYRQLSRNIKSSRKESTSSELGYKSLMSCQAPLGRFQGLMEVGILQSRRGRIPQGGIAAAQGRERQRRRQDLDLAARPRFRRAIARGAPRQDRRATNRERVRSERDHGAVGQLGDGPPVQSPRAAVAALRIEA